MCRLEIIVRKGELAVARHLLPPGEYEMGRDADCDIQIDSPEVSRHHARLTITTNDLKVEDLASSSGTMIDGARITQPTSFQTPKVLQIGGAMVHINRLTEAEPGALAVTLELEPVPPPPPFLQAIRKPRNYEVGKELSRGGMGAVLEAQDLNIDRAVAMKVILPAKACSPAMLRRFICEAQVLGRLEHPNIVPIHELGTDEQGRVFYTMKLVRGVTLQRVLNQIKAGEAETIRQYPLSHLLTVFQKVCDAVGFAHSKGVVHRDLKPDNIMLGEFGEVLVMDWGIAKILASSSRSLVLESKCSENANQAPANREQPPGVAEKAKPFQTLEGQILGTPNFMAPEQAGGRIAEIDVRSDIYALGGILYNILTLRPPISSTGSLAEMLDRITRGEIRLPTDYNRFATQKSGDEPQHARAGYGLPHCPGLAIPEALSAVAMKALALKSPDRYQQVRELQREIEAFQTGFATVAEHASIFTLARLWARRHRAAFAALALVALVAGMFSVKVMLMVKELRGTAPTFYNKSVALMAAGKFDEALQPIDYAITLVPNEAGYHLLRGHILQSSLRIMDAEAAYQRSLQLKPGDEVARANLELCQVILKTQPGATRDLPASMLALLQEIMRKQGRADESRAMLARLLAQDATIRKLFYDTWRPKLDQAGLKGTLTISDGGRVELSFYNTPVKELTVLAGMPLNALSIDGAGEFGDLSPLAGMRLDHLVLRGTKVSDLSLIRGMPLKHLDLFNSWRITNLSPLVGMPLEYVNLDGVQAGDLRPLTGMRLKALHLQGPAITRVGVLQGMPLENLSLRNTGVTNLNVLQGMQLKSLALGGTKVGDLRPLEGMPLSDLNIDATAVTDLTSLRGMPLQALSAAATKIMDLSPLSGMLLTFLSLHNTRVSDVRPLAGMPLNYLDLRGTPVTDLRPLAGMAIDGIALGDSRIKDLASVRAIKVSSLELDRTSVSDLSPIDGLPLKQLLLEGCNGLRDLSPLARSQQLEVLTIPLAATNAEVLRQLPKLERLGYTRPGSIWERVSPVAEFWKAYDARADKSTGTRE